jgi:hypothetical protein
MITTLNPSPEQLLLYVDNFLTPEEVVSFIALGDTANYVDAGIRQPDGTYKFVADYRQNMRGHMPDEQLAVAMFERTKQYLPEKIREFTLSRFHPLFRFYKYNRGDFFNKHKDGSTKEGLDRSLITFMIYLTESGVTSFEGYPDIKCVPGRMVLFNHKMTHSSPVLESDVTKIVIRTDIMYSPIYSVPK